MNKKLQIFTLVLTMLIISLACTSEMAEKSTPARRSVSIPKDAVKISPEQDFWPPAAAAGWSDPVPLEGINTAGGEDSPFLTVDGTLYFFFTPDVNIPAERQIGDGVTGIWMAAPQSDGFSAPERVWLAEPSQLHLDGCPFVMGNWMAFCSVREGNQREIDIYTAEFVDGKWSNVQNWGEPINQEYWVGELHIANDGFLYFGSDRADGYGGTDLWASRWEDGAWGAPVNLGAVINSGDHENRPFVTADGTELWFDSVGRGPGPSVFRSIRQNDGSWGPPEEIIWSFAGEPTLTADGNTLYFVHHYFNEDLSQMIEADIYVSYRLDAE